MQQYLNQLRFILESGVQSSNRTGIDTLEVFGTRMQFDLNAGFPAVTTKKLAWKSVVGELLWFLEGSSDIRQLSILTYDGDPNRSTIWHANAQADEWVAKTMRNWDAGRIYGVQWRRWRTADGQNIDQIAQLIEGIRKNPHSRRHILTAWNPGELDDMCLPPCHILCQFFVQNNRLSCQLYQRSCDFPLGVPFNIASYSLLTHMIAHVCDLQVGEFIHVGGNAHIYLNQIPGVMEQLSRSLYPLPTLCIKRKCNNIDDFKPDDFELLNYQYHSHIHFPFAS